MNYLGRTDKNWSLSNLWLYGWYRAVRFPSPHHWGKIKKHPGPLFKWSITPAPLWPINPEQLQTRLLIKRTSLCLFPSDSIITCNALAIFASLRHVWENSRLHYFHKRGTNGPCPPSPWESVLITTMLQLKTRPLLGQRSFHQKLCQFKFTQLSDTLLLFCLQWHTQESCRVFRYQSACCVTEILTTCSASGCWGAPTICSSNYKLLTREPQPS